MAALGDGSADVRENAAMALGQLRDPAAVEPLVAVLADKSPGVREQAAMSLGQLRDARAVEPLLAAVADTNADVREQAVFALVAAARQAGHAETHRRAGGHRPRRARAGGIRAEQLRDPSAAPALAGLLSDKDARRCASRPHSRCGQLRSEAAVDGLIGRAEGPVA